MEASLTEEELTKAVQTLAKDKNPSPDGLMAESFRCFWIFTSGDFTRMVNESLARDGFQMG
jgi:hypothetical protein